MAWWNATTATSASSSWRAGSSPPDDFNDQLTEWLATANARTVRVLGARPVDALVEGRARMLALPPIAPTTGLRTTVNLARDYYVRIDSVDYSVDPRRPDAVRSGNWISTI